MNGPRIGELFAGYGGLGMGVQAVYGGSIAWVSDIDKGANKILAHRFPGVPNLGDITTVDWSQVEPVDILTGGSPCQDLSHAGRRAGMTEGTRSNLWVAMREAIAQLRPATVVWENVRGAFSAAADSEVEPCAGCVGDGSGVHLRALGRVLGDLSDLGYDCRWHGLRAADVGAPHGRFRVFVVATDANGGRRGERHQGLRGVPVPYSFGTGALLPTPETGESPNGHGRRGGRPGNGRQSGASLDAVVSLLPTPTTQDGSNNGGASQHGRNTPPLNAVAALLPTPAVNDMGEGKTVDAWDEWTAKMKAAHGNGNGHGASLAIEAQRLLPTPRASDGPDASSHARSWSTTDRNLHTIVKLGEISVRAAEDGSAEDVRGLRDADVPQEVRGETRGSDALFGSEDLLAVLRQHEAAGDEGCAALAGSEAQGRILPRLRGNEEAARASRGQESGEQRPVEPDDALRELSSQVALARGSAGVDWGAYTDAIRRWEVVLGRLAPPPTMVSKKGNPQLCPEFVTWLMGLPAGWITDVPGITRNEALKALGNGVVPQQAAEALRVMAAWQVAA